MDGLINQPKKATEIENLLLPILAAHEMEVVDVEYCRENGSRMLRVFIDTPHGVGVEDCSAATELVREIIDPIEAYDYDYLEVSSPGLERIIKKEADFIRFTGERVRVKTIEPYEFKKRFTGTLVEYTEQHITVNMDQELISIPTDIVLSVRLFPEI